MKILMASPAARPMAWLAFGAFALGFGPALQAQEATWSDVDIGTATPGSSSVSGDVYTVRGSGADIYGSPDHFHYFYRAWSGDGMFIVRVTSMDYTFNWAKAGIMIRADLSDSAQHAMALINPDKVTGLIYRSTPGSGTTACPSVPDDQKVMPMWVKLVHEGDSFQMEYSFDGITWGYRASTSFSMPPSGYVGLAVCSHVEGTLCTAVFDHFSVGPVTPTQLEAIGHSPTRVDLKWVDNNLTETGFQIERAAGSPSGFVQVGTAPANATSFSDPTAAPATTYYYRVRAVLPAGPGEYSASAAATTAPAAPAGWNSGDIGDTSLTGSSTALGGVFSITGAGTGVGSVRYYQPSMYKGDYGADVPGFSDEFQYCSQSWTGEGEMVARLTGFSGAATGHAGLMVRVAADDASSFNAFVFVRPDGGVGMMARPGTLTTSMGYLYYYQRETSSYYAGTGGAPPIWLKLVRQSDGVMSYSSADGATWTELGWVTTPLTTSVQFGLGASSQADGTAATLLTANFDRIRIGAITTPIPPPDPPTNVQAGMVLERYLNFTWTNPAHVYDGVEVHKSTDGVNFTRVGGGSSIYTDSSVNPDTDYYYRLRTVRGSSISMWTPVLHIHTLAYPPTPTNFVATAVSGTQVNLTWTDNSTNEDGFMITGSTDGSNYTWYASPAANMTSYSLTGLVPATTYYFRLIAYPTDPYASPVYATATVTTASGSTTVPAAPSNLLATVVGPTRIDLSWTDNASNETGFRLERSTDGTNFTGLMTFPANTTSCSDIDASPVTTFYYRVRASNGDATPSAWSNVAQATTPGGSGWSSGDVGAVAAAGSSSQSASTFTISGSGFDIWNQNDEFRYTYEPWTGDGAITARVTRLDDTSGWAKAALMFRATLADTSTHAMMVVSTEHGLDFQYRTTTGGYSDAAPATGTGGVPVWIRIVRAGNTFTGFESSDGTAWIQRGTITIADMPNTAYVGMAVTSHNDGVLTTAVFENVTVTSGATPPPPAPSPPVPPSALSAVALNSTRIDLSWTDNSSDETGFQVERSTDGVNFVAVSTVGSNVTAYSDATVAASTNYYYRVAARRDTAISNYSNVATATTPTGSTPPASGTWQSQDVGSVAAAGNASESNGAVTISGSGADIWNQADGFRYWCQSWSGDGEIIARVTGLTDTNPWSKAGLMFRETLVANSRHATMLVSAEEGSALQYRAATGGDSATTTPSAGGVPQWLRIVRSGTTFTGYTSTDGVAWTQAGSVTLNLPSTIYAGLAVTSHADGALCTATFDHVSLSGGSGVLLVSPPAAPSSLMAAAASDTQINLIWTDNSTNETGFEVEMSTNNATYTRITTTDANIPGYQHTGLTPSTTYYYRVRAVNGAGASGYTNMAFATTAPASLPPPSGNWQSQDVGSVAAAGNDTVSITGSIVMKGSGADIWNQADAFHFRHETWTGDGEIIARVVSLSNTNGWAKAGVMFRNSVGSGSMHAFMCVSAANGTALQSRTTTGGDSASTGGRALMAPCWVRLVRNGTTFIGYDSTDGMTWNLVGSVAVNLTDPIEVGLAVTSHNDGVLATAEFDNVTVRALSGGTLAAPTTLAATATAYDRVTLSWTDNSSSETGFEVQMAPNATAFSSVGTVGANSTSITVTGLSAEATYYFRVRAFNASSSSSFSNTATATTPVYPAPSTLGAPTNLTATATGQNTVSLAWADNSSSELGFEVGMSTDGVTYDWAGKTLANATTAQAAGLTPGTTYYFQVRAYQSDSAGTGYIHSSPTNTATATTFSSTTPPPVPVPPGNLTAVVSMANQITLNWDDNSANESGFEVERSTNNATFALIATTGTNVPRYSDNTVAAGTTYYYRVRAVNAGGASTYTNVASATTPTVTPTSTWYHADLGLVGVAGSDDADTATASITVRGSGNDIWDTADAGRFVYQQRTGDCVVDSQVGSIGNTNGWAKAGVMIRESTMAGARNVFAFLTPGIGMYAQARSDTGGTTAQNFGPNWAVAPYWVRIARSTNTFTVSTSSDGINWTTVATYTITMNATVDVGFAVTSHDNAQLNTAVFNEPSVR